MISLIGVSVEDRFPPGPTVGCALQPISKGARFCLPHIGKVDQPERFRQAERAREWDDVGFTDKVFSAAKITSVVDKLALEGASPVDALADADVHLSDLNSPAARISRNQLIQCYRNAIALSHDPHLAYAIGSSVHLSAYGMYGYAMLCSTNFRSTMDFAVRYHQLATPLATIAFEERDGLGIWTIEPLTHPKIDSRLYRFVAELQIATHISLQRDIMGEGFKPREILLAYPPAADFHIPSATPAVR